MTRPRSALVSPDVSRYYHCITRCVRQAFLLQEGKTDRKRWLEDRLKEVADVYAVSVVNYAILDNHFHLLVRLDVDIARSWSDEEVIERWAKLHPPRVKRKLITVDTKWISDEAKDKAKVEKLRKRLCDLGWFMKEVKEPLARLCNFEDGKKGTFFEGRYKCIAILDDQALLNTAIYIDLNPFAAGLSEAPELSVYTSLYTRIQKLHAWTRSNAQPLARYNKIEPFPSSFEDDLWLCPIEDRRRDGAVREGLVQSFTFANYLLLLDSVARKPRDGKAHLPAETTAMLERIGYDLKFWLSLQNRDYKARLAGSFFASSSEKLKQAAAKLGLHHCWNLKERPDDSTQAAVSTDVTAC